MSIKSAPKIMSLKEEYPLRFLDFLMLVYVTLILIIRSQN